MCCGQEKRARVLKEAHHVIVNHAICDGRWHDKPDDASGLAAAPVPYHSAAKKPRKAPAPCGFFPHVSPRDGLTCGRYDAGKSSRPQLSTERYAAHCVSHTLKECVVYHTLTKFFVCGTLEFSKIAH